MRLLEEAGQQQHLLARFVVEVRAMCKPVACCDLLMLLKQLPYVFRRALSQKARAGGAAAGP